MVFKADLFMLRIGLGVEELLLVISPVLFCVYFDGLIQLGLLQTIGLRELQ